MFGCCAVGAPLADVACLPQAGMLDVGCSLMRGASSYAKASADEVVHGAWGKKVSSGFILFQKD